jgi:hypothetical protein
MTVMPHLYGYYVIRDIDNILGNPGLVFATCALEAMISELEKGEVVVYIQLRDHD